MNDIAKIRIDTETKKKAIFMLKTKGTDLSKEVRKMCEKLAEEYDKKNSK
jgi:antitoxin component of RelBE/YafQ-DinJ toxin-antitoxin module